MCWIKLIEFFFLISLISTEISFGTYGNPLTFKGIEEKSRNPQCPYGKCYMDRCKRICSCRPEGNSCTKSNRLNLLKSLLACENVNVDNNCPLGQTFRDDLWPQSFVCYCNNDSSQTYECFDLAKQGPADAEELIKYSKTKNVHKQTEILIQKRK